MNFYKSPMGRRVIAAVSIAMAGLLAAEYLLGRYTRETPGSFGFYAWFGFGSCVAFILAALAFGRLVKKRDDYYDE